ncbi:MAG TPA: aldo/keto reductase [Melioribacteraceae bacterium]|nr:aldo/keto reductase [Melioribacteraceae bacterium]
MKYNSFGKTDLSVSEIGFGAWGIGGPAMAGSIPIGWGNVDDNDSIAALKKSYDLGITFYDTADFYGLGHSEELLGKVFGSNKSIIIATKVGHKLNADNSIMLDYSYNHIIDACNNSLKRLKRDYIDLYQLHSAKINHLIDGECIKAMEDLLKAGKIRYWGLSLNTFNPFPEAEFLINNNLGNSFQLVFNIINQRALSIIQDAYKKGYAIIARMPLQFGLLTGKFNKYSSFPANDHRSFRLNYEILSKTLDELDKIWFLTEKYNITKTSLSLSFIASTSGISTLIPGIKNVQQAIDNTTNIIKLEDEDIKLINRLYSDTLNEIVILMERQG